MDQLGRILIAAGVLIAAAGVLLVLGPRLGLRIGQLPLDFQWQRGAFSFYLPLGTSILLSVVLTLILMWFGRR